MPVTSIAWDLPDDIHVLRGRTTRPLDALLRLHHSGPPTNNPTVPPPAIPSTFLANQTAVLTADGITVTFTPPTFKAVPLGFSINPTTGVVTADARPAGTTAIGGSARPWPDPAS